MAARLRLDDVRSRLGLLPPDPSALDGGGLDQTSQDRYHAWGRTLEGNRNLADEHLLPRLDRQVPIAFPPPFMRRRRDAEADPAAVEDAVAGLGPWRLPFVVGDEHLTLTGRRALDAAARISFRRELITGGVAELLGDDMGRSTILDLGCNAGFFSLDVADRGAAHVDGVDLRPQNIAQARWLAEHYGIDNVDFSVADVDAFDPDEQWDVVLNLGLLYHVTDPLQLLRRTYELCREFAVIDTLCHKELVSAYILVGNKDVDRPTEGGEEFEFHPTYRAVIDSLAYAGFSDVVELTATSDPPHPKYERRRRRCFLALK